MVEQRVMKVLKDVAGVDFINSDADIRKSLGLDSLDMLELLTALEMEFGVSIEDEALQGWSTVRDVILFLEETVENG